MISVEVEGVLVMVVEMEGDGGEMMSGECVRMGGDDEGWGE